MMNIKIFVWITLSILTFLLINHITTTTIKTTKCTINNCSLPSIDYGYCSPLCSLTIIIVLALTGVFIHKKKKKRVE